jgi:AraC-like DNA-binding protein
VSVLTPGDSSLTVRVNSGDVRSFEGLSAAENRLMNNSSGDKGMSGALPGGEGMTHVSAMFVRKMIEQAPGSLDPAALWHSVGLTPADAADPSAGVQDIVYYGLLETLAAAEAPDISFHLRTSAGMKCADFGAIGLAWKSAPTLRRSFQRHDRYARAFNTTSTFRLIERDGKNLWTHHRPEPKRLGMYLSTEGTMGTYVAMCRETTFAENKPEAVQFCHPEPAGSLKALEEYFQCPVTFGADIDAIILPEDRLDKPNTVGDESIWRFLTAHIEETLADQDAEETLTQQIVQNIVNMLSEGVPTLSDVASEFGMSARTLQRRLAEEGHSFQTVVDEARRQLAERFLADTRYSIAEIAFLTGFSEQSAFTRAFKRWAGRTPGAFRLGASARVR